MAGVILEAVPKRLLRPSVHRSDFDVVRHRTKRRRTRATYATGGRSHDTSRPDAPMGVGK